MKIHRYIAALIVVLACCHAGAVTLTSGDLTLTLDDRTGEIAAAARSGRAIALTAAVDSYTVTAAAEAKPVAVSAAQDTVRETRLENGAAVFVCVNPELPGFTLTKRYGMSPDGTGFTKQLTAEADHDAGFFAWTEAVNFAPGARNDSYYWRECYALMWPQPMILDAKATEKGTVGSGRVALIDRKNPHGVGFYVREVQKGPVVMPDGTDCTFVPDGWRMRVGEDYVEPGRDFTATACLVFFDGDHMAFNAVYLADPVLHDRFFRPRPAWMRDVLTILNYCHAYLRDYPGELEALARVSEEFPDACVMMTFMMGWCNATGYYPTEGKLPMSDSTAEQIRAQIATVRERTGNRCKLGLYTAARVNSATPPGQEHEAWRMIGDDGEIIAERSTENSEMLYHWNMALPEVQQYFRDLYAGLQRGYDLDYLYIDIGGVPGAGPRDWKHRKRYQSSDNYAAVMASMLAAAKDAKGREVALAGNTVAAPPYDLGYYEHALSADWRQNAALMQYAKFMEVTGQRACLLGWDTPHVFGPEYILALGLLPAQFAPSWILNDRALFEAAFEMRQTRLTDAVIRPRWWLDGSEVECYALRQGAARLVTSIGHEAAARRIPVTLDAAGLGFAPGTAVYLWEQMFPAAPHYAGRMVTAADGTLVLTIPARRGEAALISLSDVPAVIAQVDGKEQVLALAEQPDIRLAGSLDLSTGRLELTAESVKHPIGIRMVYPADQGTPLVKIDGNPVQLATDAVSGEGDARLIALPQGKHTVEVTPDPAFPETRTYYSYRPPEAVVRRAAGAIDIDGKLDDAGWQGATEVGGFVDLRAGKPVPASHQTAVKIAWDDENLYCGFTCFDPATPELKALRTVYNDWVYCDPCVEVFLDTDDTRARYDHIIVNIGNGMLCERMDGGMTRYDTPAAHAEVSRGTDRWFVEMAIPWSRLGLAHAPEPGTRWGVNLCRNGVNSEAAWSWPQGFSFHTPAIFGTWSFAK